MKYLKVFIMGFITASCLPILDEIVEAVGSFIGIMEGYSKYKISQYNLKINDISKKMEDSDEEPEQTNAIGFRVREEDCEDSNDDE